MLVRFKELRFFQSIFQTWLIMTGKLPGPFEVEYLSVGDAYGNRLAFPKLTALTLLFSGISILKTCLDLNITRIHLQEGFRFSAFVDRSLTFLPFFIVSIVYRLLTFSIILSYCSFWVTLPAAILLFSWNLHDGIKR